MLIFCYWFVRGLSVFQILSRAKLGVQMNNGSLFRDESYVVDDKLFKSTPGLVQE